jgi:hypothetical protein
MEILAEKKSKTPGLKRYMVATKDFKEGETIFSERAYVGPRDTLKSNKYWCLVGEILKDKVDKIAYIKKNLYCSPSMLENWNVLDDDHVKQIRLVMPQISVQDIKHLFGIVATNALRVYVKDPVAEELSTDAKVSFALYIKLSMLNHCCSANTRLEDGTDEEGVRIKILKANRKINKGDVLTISYVGVVMQMEPGDPKSNKLVHDLSTIDKSTRRALIKENQGFLCHCSLCCD